MDEPLVAEPFSFPEEPFLAPFQPAERAPAPSVPRPRFRLSARPADRRVAPILPSDPPLFPWLARHFAPGEATLWCGPKVAVEPVLEMLYAGSALARGRVSLLEGANRLHPYRVGELGRSLGLDATETLRHLRLARAFTAYQLVSLADRWARDARRHPPTLLVGHDLPMLFRTDEVPAEERDPLLRHVARTLADLLREVRVPLLLTLGPDGFSSFPGLADEGPRWADVLVFERSPSVLRARAFRDDARLVVAPRGAGQTGLDKFGGDRSAEEVIGWDALLRPTVKRSKSG